MKSTDATNPVIDLAAYRSSHRRRCTAPSRAVVETAPAVGRIELRVELDDLARSLLAIRKWLTGHGCSHQVFHCVRAGSEAVITVKFDTPRAGLTGKFYDQFGARS